MEFIEWNKSEVEEKKMSKNVREIERMERNEKKKTLNDFYY